MWPSEWEKNITHLDLKTKMAANSWKSTFQNIFLNMKMKYFHWVIALLIHNGLDGLGPLINMDYLIANLALELRHG